MIYDLMPFSVADFPGNVAATVFISGCNFACPYCHNSSLITSIKGTITEDDIFKYLDKREGLIDGVCITGGEPTLWPGLLAFIVKIKAKRFKVKLDTNGARPSVVTELLDDGLLDYIAMDIKAPIQKYGLFVNNSDDIARVKESVSIIMDCGISNEFRTTVHEKLLSEDDFKEIGVWLSGAKRYALQGYKYSEGVLNKKLCGKSPCNIKFLKKIKDEVLPYFDEVLVRS